MAKKCRAMVFNGDGTYELRQFDKPTPPPGGAVIKVEAVGMCRSDLEQIKGQACQVRCPRWWLDTRW